MFQDSSGALMKIETLHLAVCMKPLEGTFAQNALTHGVAGFNINGCRIPIDIEDEPPVGDAFYLKKGSEYPNQGKSSSKIMGVSTDRVEITMSKGRFPANVILDKSAEVLAGFPETHGAGNIRKSSCGHITAPTSYKTGRIIKNPNYYANHGGSTARFFWNFDED